MFLKGAEFLGNEGTGSLVIRWPLWRVISSVITLLFAGTAFTLLELGP
jgi:hypothetical protein